MTTVEVSSAEITSPTTNYNTASNQLKLMVEALRNPAVVNHLQRLFTDPGFAEDLKRIKSNPVGEAALSSAAEIISQPDLAVELFSMLHAKLKDGNSLNNVDGLIDLRKMIKDPRALEGIWDKLYNADSSKEVRTSSTVTNHSHHRMITSSLM